jgi:hypothetical protein
MSRSNEKQATQPRNLAEGEDAKKGLMPPPLPQQGQGREHDEEHQEGVHRTHHEDASSHGAA